MNNDNIINKAGVVAYRTMADGTTEVLLISYRKFKNIWIFPVGTVEEGESLEDAARRECMEESGWLVEIQDNLGFVELEQDGFLKRFSFFNALPIRDTDDYEKDRDRIWVNADQLNDFISELFKPIAIEFKNKINSDH